MSGPVSPFNLPLRWSSASNTQEQGQPGAFSIPGLRMKGSRIFFLSLLALTSQFIESIFLGSFNYSVKHSQELCFYFSEYVFFQTDFYISENVAERQCEPRTLDGLM